MRSRSRHACAPMRERPELTKSCGARSVCCMTSITTNIRAILSHAEYTGVARISPMEKTLFACDELAGFITACALVKPGKSLAEVEAPSVRKKMKDKAFARNVHREDIIAGAADLGLHLEVHIAFCIEAMRSIAKELGLDGSAAKSA
jgi:predicted hydrolase (HD superfamily)